MIRSLSAVEGGVPLGLWCAVPAYTGEIKTDTAHAINLEMLTCYNRKVPFELYVHQQDSIITRCRNAMAMKFLSTDPKHFTDMVFLDSDVAFPEGAMLKLAGYPVDIVGAAYPFRQDPLGFPLTLINHSMKIEDNGLMKVAGMPAGFLKIGRKALQTIMDRFPDYWYTEANVPQQKAWRFFEFLVIENRFFGEDYAFSALAREAGLDIWCDPDITMKHVGMKPFTGNLKGWMMIEEAKKAGPMGIIEKFNELAKKVAA